MDPNLSSMVIIFSTSKTIFLRVEDTPLWAVTHKSAHALEISGQGNVLVSKSSLD